MQLVLRAHASSVKLGGVAVHQPLNSTVSLLLGLRDLARVVQASGCQPSALNPVGVVV
jgi:hypothetical protein